MTFAKPSTLTESGRFKHGPAPRPIRRSPASRAPMPSTALVAQTTDLNLDLLVLNCPRHGLGRGLLGPNIHSGETLDLSAINAYEVGVPDAIGMVLVGNLESPNVITKIASFQETGVSQVHEVSVNGRPIQAKMGCRIDQVRMRQRRFRLHEHLIHRDPARRRPQARVTNSVPNGRLDLGGMHSVSLTLRTRSEQRRDSAESHAANSLAPTLYTQGNPHIDAGSARR
jgi:hypothetical protein